MRQSSGAKISPIVEESPTVDSRKTVSTTHHHMPHFTSSPSRIFSSGMSGKSHDFPFFRQQRLFSNSALLGYIGPATSKFFQLGSFNRDSSDLKPQKEDPSPIQSQQTHFTDQYSYEQIQSHINYYYGIHDAELRHEYHNFHKYKKSTGFLLFLFVFLFAIRLPSSILNIMYDWDVLEEYADQPAYSNTVKSRFVLSILTLLLTCIGMTCCGILLHGEHDASCLAVAKVWQVIKPLFTIKWKSKYFPSISSRTAASIFYAQSQLFFILIFLRRSFLYQCEHDGTRDHEFSQELANSIISQLGGSGECIDATFRSTYMILSMMIMFLFPLLLFSNIPEIGVLFVWIHYALAVIVYIGSAFVLECYGSLLISFIIIAAASLVIMDIQKRNILIFIKNRKLKELLLENQKMMEENQATELRHMIGNVAHDLKTVSITFDEIISMKSTHTSVL